MSNYITNLPIDIQELIFKKKTESEFRVEILNRYDVFTIPELKKGIKDKFEQFCPDEDFVDLKFSYFNKSDYVRVANKVRPDLNIFDKMSHKNRDKIFIKHKLNNDKILKSLNQKKCVSEST